mgnify:CR=1 FL=1
MVGFLKILSCKKKFRHAIYTLHLCYYMSMQFGKSFAATGSIEIQEWRQDVPCHGNNDIWYSKFVLYKSASYKYPWKLQELAENEYEKSCLSSIILAHDICVKFDQIGALDDVKKTLKDLIILPLQRPELFRRGNLKKVRHWQLIC